MSYKEDRKKPLGLNVISCILFGTFIAKLLNEESFNKLEGYVLEAGMKALWLVLLVFFILIIFFTIV